MKINLNRRFWLFPALILLAVTGGSAYAAFSGGGDVEATGDPSNAAMLLLIYMLLALGFSFLCSIAEAVLLSLRPSFIESVRETDPKTANLMQRLKLDNIDRSLAAILTLNTIAHTVGAIGSGAQASILFGSAWFGLFSAVMTLMILFLSEIIPKTIGALYWATLAKPMAYIIYGLILFLYPIVWVSEKLTKLVSGGKDVHIFSRDEFVAMAKLGEESGHLHLKESRIIRNLFKLGTLNAADIMTPRTVMFALPETLTVEEAMALIVEQTFSRIPLIQGDKDHTTGFVLRDEILIRETDGRGHEELLTFKHELPAIPESMSVSALLEELVQEHRHIAVVIDEYGGTKGILTMEDVIETLIGAEIIDEMDAVDDMRVWARKLWERRSRAMGVKLETGETAAGDSPAP